MEQNHPAEWDKVALVELTGDSDEARRATCTGKSSQLSFRNVEVYDSNNKKVKNKTFHVLLKLKIRENCLLLLSLWITFMIDSVTAFLELNLFPMLFCENLILCRNIFNFISKSLCWRESVPGTFSGNWDENSVGVYSRRREITATRCHSLDGLIEKRQREFFGAWYRRMVLCDLQISFSSWSRSSGTWCQHSNLPSKMMTMSMNDGRRQQDEWWMKNQK